MTTWRLASPAETSPMAWETSQKETNSHMEKLKSNLCNMACVLTGVALICGALLAYVNNATEPAIAEQKDATLAEGIKSVLAAEQVSVSATNEVQRTIDGKQQTFTIYTTDHGTAVESTDPNGFGGNLKVLVGFNDKGDITGYTVLEHAETPGLGAKAQEWFRAGKGNIIGKNPGTDNFTVSKDGGDIDAITASTITSRAFLRAVQQAYNTMKQSCNATTGATKQCKK